MHKLFTTTLHEGDDAEKHIENMMEWFDKYLKWVKILIKIRELG
jgi:hypothetical protein